jgi:quercetin dioxygenase-like cupin family protein
MRLVLTLLFSLTTAVVTFAQDPVKVDPAHYRVLFENAHMRVLEYRDKAGYKAPMHSHPAYMTYVTAAGKTKVMLPSGEMKVNEHAGSEFACHPPTQHATENIGSTGTQEVVVEFKDAANPCSSTQ